MSQKMDALAASPFKILPQENILPILANLKFEDLKLFAFVCKAFKRISEDNQFWKSLYENRWGKQTDLGPEFSRKWKNYYIRASKVDQRVPNSDQSPFYWSRGLPITAISCVGAQSNPNLPSMYAVIREKTPATHTKVSTILSLLNEDVEKAFLHYLEHRDYFIKNCAVLGAWLSMLFQARRTIKLVKDQEIYFPNTPAEDWKQIKQFHQGCTIAWMEQEKVTEALITLNCLKLMHQRIAEGVTPEDHSFFYTIQVLCSQNQTSSHTWEKIGDILNELKIPNSLAMEAYIRALNTNACISLDKEMTIAIKLCRAFIAMKVSNPDLIDKKKLCIPLVIGEKYLSRLKQIFDPVSFAALIDLVVAYQLTEYYEPLLKEANLRCYQDALIPESAQFYASKIELCILAGHFKAATRTWVSLCHNLSQNIEEDELDELRIGIFKKVYQLLDLSSAACDVLVVHPSKCKFVQVGVAYALFRLDYQQKALEHISTLSLFVDSSDLPWLRGYCRKEFNAVIIYSLFLESEQELENFYIEMQDFHSQLESYIYHNLAVRLYFAKSFDMALSYATLALESDTIFAETWVVKGLCLREKGDQQASEEAFLKAQELDPENFLEITDYTQEKLILLIKSES